MLWLITGRMLSVEREREEISEQHSLRLLRKQYAITFWGASASKSNMYATSPYMVDKVNKECVSSVRADNGIKVVDNFQRRLRWFWMLVANTFNILFTDIRITVMSNLMCQLTLGSIQHIEFIKKRLFCLTLY